MEKELTYLERIEIAIAIKKQKEKCESYLADPDFNVLDEIAKKDMIVYESILNKIKL